MLLFAVLAGLGTAPRHAALMTPDCISVRSARGW